MTGSDGTHSKDQGPDSVPQAKELEREEGWTDTDRELDWRRRGYDQMILNDPISENRIPEGRWLLISQTP